MNLRPGTSFPGPGGKVVVRWQNVTLRYVDLTVYVCTQNCQSRFHDFPRASPQHDNKQAAGTSNQSTLTRRPSLVRAPARAPARALPKTYSVSMNLLNYFREGSSTFDLEATRVAAAGGGFLRGSCWVPAPAPELIRSPLFCRGFCRGKTCYRNILSKRIIETPPHK